MTADSPGYLARSSASPMYQNNATSREKDIAATLRFAELFDSAEYAYELLSVSYLAERLKA